MLIEVANEQTRPFVRQIWRDVFKDEETYIDLFFGEKYQDKNTLVAIEDNKVVAALQMLPYELSFYGEKLPFSYLTGLSTLPEYRNRGLMGHLITQSHQLMRDRNIPLSILIPAEIPLFAYYERFGYAQTFDRSELSASVSLKEIVESTENEESAYQLFDKVYNKHDFCVQKNFQDFQTIVKEARQDNFPGKGNLWGASRIIDAQRLLHLYAKSNPQYNFRVQVRDSQFGDKFIEVKSGSAQLLSSPLCPDFSVDEKELVQLLFGYKINSNFHSLSSLFQEHHPIMNYMLE